MASLSSTNLKGGPNPRRVRHAPVLSAAVQAVWHQDPGVRDGWEGPVQMVLAELNAYLCHKPSLQAWATTYVWTSRGVRVVYLFMLLLIIYIYICVCGVYVYVYIYIYMYRTYI